jgi:hypothetical protein
MPNALRDDAPAGWHGAAGKAAACLLVAALLAVTGALTLAHVRTAERIATLEGEVALLTSHSDVSHLDTRLAHVGKEAKASTSAAAREEEVGLIRAARQELKRSVKEQMEGLDSEVAGMRRKLLTTMASVSSAVGQLDSACTAPTMKHPALLHTCSKPQASPFSQPSRVLKLWHME